MGQVKTALRRRAQTWLASRPGLAASGGALLAQFLLYKAEPGAPFAPYALGNRFIRMSPGPLATEAIERLGHHAILLVAWATIAGTLAFGALLGRRAPMLFGAMALGLSAIAAKIDPVAHRMHHTLEASLLAGSAAWLVASVVASRSTATPDAEKETPETDDGRRRLLRTILIGGGILFLGGWAATRRFSGGRREAIGTGRTIMGDPSFDAVKDLSPLITSTDDHYTVDINLANPVIDGGSWRLKISGALAQPRSYSLDDLRSRPAVEMPALLQCISNQIGGDLAGNAVWVCVPLAPLFAEAARGSNARLAVAHGADGYHEGIPLDGATLNTVLVAIGMNGELLRGGHGYPARLIFPGRYGMRQVKWLTEIELIDHDEEGYWVERGWDPQAIMRTGSRIDAPRGGARLAPAAEIAGVAWAGDRGVSTVEVSTDGGETWTEAELESASGPLAWRRWRLQATLDRGSQTLLVRAYDGTGTVQDADFRPPHPSGATGYHRVSVTVS